MDEPDNAVAIGSPVPTRAAEVDIVDILQIVWASRWLVALCVALGMAGGIFYLNIATKTYSTELKVMPSAGPTAATKPGLGSLSGLASLAGLTNISSEGPTRFEVYLNMLTSRSVAAELARDPIIMNEIFADERDAHTGTWREPDSLWPQAVRSVRLFLGQNPPPWHPPSADRLQQHLQKSLEIGRSTPKDPLTYIVYYSRRRAFGPYLITRLDATADRLIRQKNLAEARSYVDYLEERLPRVKIVEQRQALVTILSDQEKAIMTASSSLPYAASALEPPVASDYPARPRVAIILVAAAVAGLAVGVAVALARRNRRR